MGISICDSGNESILIPEEVVFCANAKEGAIRIRNNKTILIVVCTGQI
jgi:hypothetical protein